MKTILAYWQGVYDALLYPPSDYSNSRAAHVAKIMTETKFKGDLLYSLHWKQAIVLIVDKIRQIDDEEKHKNYELD